MIEMSMVVATNRFDFLKRFCASFGRDAIVRERREQFEVVFVGPLNDDPNNYQVPVRFIQSDKQAALCWEIGARAARGRLLGLAADDCIFSDGYLDNVVVMAEAARRQGRHYDMFTGRYLHNGQCQLAGQRMMSVPGMPLLPIGGFTFTATHHLLGGVDSRFRAVLWDTELYMNFVQKGGVCHLVGGHTCHEVNPTSKLFVDNHVRDQAVIQSIWFRNGRPQLTRNGPRERYGDALAGTPTVTTI